MSATGDPWARELPADLPASVVAEIGQFVANVPDGASCVATGSIIEGLGNANSDIDLYLIQDLSQGQTRPISIGIRNSRYVDCEYFVLDAVERLVTEVNQASPAEAARFELRDFDRYYRLAIGAWLIVTEQAEPVLRTVDRAHVCGLFARWSLLRAREQLARSAVAAALGDPRAAVIRLRETAAWRASGVLAGQGEGYPPVKWVTVKAARRFGAGTAAYLDCLDGYWTTLDGLVDSIGRLRHHLGGALDQQPVARFTWALADTVDVIADGDVPHLTLGRKSIVRAPGLAGLITTRLAAGAPWAEAVAQIAAELAVPPQDVRLVAAGDLRELADLGYLTPGPDEEGSDVTG
jgi:hypothetical protein